MKIIIFSILFTVQAQYIDDEYLSNEYSTKENDLAISTIAQNFNSFDSQTRAFSSIDDLDLTTPTDQINTNFEEQWFNVNETRKKDSSKSTLYWKRTSGKRSTYILTSEPRCVNRMCSIQLKYNGTVSTRLGGCLSFSLQTRGQPEGQIWIVEDKEHENSSQRIQLINKTLHIEHSLRSKIKNLSIETKILFRNPQKDALILSNIKVNWQGSCPKSRQIPTPSPHLIDRRATINDEFLTLSSQVSDGMNTLTTNEDFQTSQSYSIDDTTTIRYDHRTKTKRRFSLLNEKNFGWFMSLVTIFCVTLILSAIGHSFWLIRRYHYFTWHLGIQSPIQVIARRSLRSSTRSERQIATISQIASEISNNDLQKEQTDISLTDSDRSMPMSYYTYL